MINTSIGKQMHITDEKKHKCLVGLDSEKLDGVFGVFAVKDD